MNVDLDQLEKELESQLKLHPLYRKLEAVRLLKQDYQKFTSSVAENPTETFSVQANNSSLLNNPIAPVTTPEQRDKITAASVEVLKESANSLTTKELFGLLLRKGIYVPGKKPSVTLSSILYGRSAEVMRDEEGKWKARSL